jgi:hypothetical protein
VIGNHSPEEPPTAVSLRRHVACACSLGAPPRRSTSPVRIFNARSGLKNGSFPEIIIFFTKLEQTHAYKFFFKVGRGFVLLAKLQTCA